MQVSVLGPLRVTLDDGPEVAVDRGKERAVLAALALTPGVPVIADRLIDALWPDAPPRTAAKTLQNHVLRLRRTLGPYAIITEPSGYRLAVDASGVDAVRFDAAVRAAASELTPSVTAKSLTQALEDWRGDPYEDLEGWEPAEIERRRLVELRLAAEELRVEAEIACERYALATIDLEAMVTAEPLRERRWELLILALYRNGRQIDALHTCSRARTVLADEAGVLPGPALAAIERAVLRRDSMLDPGMPDFADDAVNRARRAFDAADATAHAELLTAIGEAQRQAGDPVARETLLQAASATRDADEKREATRATLLLSRIGGMGARGGDVDNARVAAMEAALDAASDDPATRARLFASLATELTWSAPIERRLALSDEALDIARTTGDPAVIVDVLVRRVNALASPDLLEVRLRDSIQCLRLADELDDPTRVWAAACTHSMMALQAERPADCDRALTIAQRAMTEVGTPGMQYVTLIRMTTRELNAGRLGPSERMIDEAFALGLATGQPETMDVYSTQLLHLRHAHGRLAELRPVLEALDLERPHPVVLPVVAWVRAEFGEVESAVAVLRRALGDAPTLRDDDFKLVALGYSAMATIRLAAADAARELLPRLTPYKGQSGNTGAFVMPPTTQLCAALEAVLERT